MDDIEGQKTASTHCAEPYTRKESSSGQNGLPLLPYLAASSGLGSTDGGNLSFQANGLHAVMIPLYISFIPSLLASGERMGLEVPLRQFLTMSMQLSRSTRVPSAQST